METGCKDWATLALVTGVFWKIGAGVMQRLAKSWSVTSRRFESCILRQFTFLGVAQLVERVLWEHEARGSRPLTETIFAVIAQWVERSVEGAGVVGSIPTRGTIQEVWQRGLLPQS